MAKCVCWRSTFFNCSHIQLAYHDILRKGTALFMKPLALLARVRSSRYILRLGTIAVLLPIRRCIRFYHTLDLILITSLFLSLSSQPLRFLSHILFFFTSLFVFFFALADWLLRAIYTQGIQTATASALSGVFLLSRVGHRYFRKVIP